MSATLSDSERINKILSYVGVSANKFAKLLGCNSPDVIYYIQRGRNGISGDMAGMIVKYKPEISLDWLLTGEGSMLKGESGSNEDSGVKFYNPEDAPYGKRRLIPLYDDVSTIGGKLQKGYSANMQSSYSSSTEFIDPGDWFKSATAAIRHYEESMTEYPSGCILALKEVMDWHLIIPGRNYMIETTEYRVTKKVQAVSFDDFIRVHSTNEEKYDNGFLIHPPFDISWNLIGRIFEVLGHVVKTGSGTMVYSNSKK